MAELVCSFSR